MLGTRRAHKSLRFLGELARNLCVTSFMVRSRPRFVDLNMAPTVFAAATRIGRVVTSTDRTITPPRYYVTHIVFNDLHVLSHSINIKLHGSTTVPQSPTHTAPRRRVLVDIPRALTSKKAI